MAEAWSRCAESIHIEHLWIIPIRSNCCSQCSRYSCLRCSFVLWLALLFSQGGSRAPRARCGRFLDLVWLRFFVLPFQSRRLLCKTGCGTAFSEGRRGIGNGWHFDGVVSAARCQLRFTLDSGDAGRSASPPVSTALLIQIGFLRNPKFLRVTDFGYGRIWLHYPFSCVEFTLNRS